MKILRDKKGRFTDRQILTAKLIGVTLIVIFLTVAVNYGLYRYNEWSARFKRVWQVPVLVKLQVPTYIEERPREPAIIISPLVYPTEAETDIEKYVCDVFGNFNCQVALAVMESESGGNPEAWNANTNGTLDVGLWQINSINWETCGMSMSDLLNPYKNTDCAKTLYDRAGGSFTPWVVYNNNWFKNKL